MVKQRCFLMWPGGCTHAKNDLFRKTLAIQSLLTFYLVVLT